jgi:hypothetical protein
MGRVVAAALGASLLVLTARPFAAAAAEARWSQNGLETESRSVPYVVEPLTPDAKRIGLTDAQVGSEVELRLVAARLIPGNPRVSADYFLYVRVLVVREAFSCELQFRRGVEFVTARNTRYALTGARTWDRLVVGTHGGRGEHVVGVLDELLDQFLTDYLKANPRR